MDYLELLKNSTDIQSQLSLIKTLIISGIDLPSELFVAIIDICSDLANCNKNLEVQQKASEVAKKTTSEKKSSSKKTMPVTEAVAAKEKDLRAQISEAANTLIRMNKKDVVTKVLAEQKVLSLDQLPVDSLAAVNSVFVDNIFKEM